MKATKKIKAIDMFCGAGGSSYGAQNAGVEIIAGFDIWEPAIKTFKTNFPNAKMYHEDLRTLDPKKLRKKIGNIDLILASPECTNHSVAKGNKERDEESRLTAFQVLKYAREFKPQWIVLENVVSMESWSRHNELLDELWDLGYYVRQAKLSADDFGVPQTRRRLFLMCSLSNKASKPTPTHTIKQSADAIIDKTEKYRMSDLIKPGRAQNTLDRANRAIKALGKDTPFLIVYYGSDKAGGWQTVSRPLRTITTLDRFAYVEPNKQGHSIRMLQPEELKLAMGFDKKFRLDLPELTRRERIKLMGNGVCPPVMTAIVNSLIAS